jgi:hypothetical protein
MFDFAHNQCKFSFLAGDVALYAVNIASSVSLPISSSGWSRRKLMYSRRMSDFVWFTRSHNSVNSFSNLGSSQIAICFDLMRFLELLFRDLGLSDNLRCLHTKVTIQTRKFFATNMAKHLCQEVSPSRYKFTKLPSSYR